MHSLNYSGLLLSDKARLSFTRATLVGRTRLLGQNLSSNVTGRLAAGLANCVFSITYNELKSLLYFCNFTVSLSDSNHDQNSTVRVNIY